MTGPAVRSMTGFATQQSALPGGRSVALTIKSVNHRHLDLSLRLAPGLDALEPGLRKLLKSHIHRGHVELTLAMVQAEKSTHGVTLTLNESLLAQYVAAFHQAKRVAGLSEQPDQQPDLNGLLRMPGVLSTATPVPIARVEDVAALEPLLYEAIAELLAGFERARAAEGETLKAELLAAMARTAALAAEAAVLRAGVAAAEFARLQQRMAELLSGADVSPERLMAEAALLAARGDIEEELVRLRTHIERFVQLLDAGGEMGRQLDFLLQEMNREANTALSKTGSSAGSAGLRLTEIGLALKLELERAREQVQNLE